MLLGGRSGRVSCLTYIEDASGGLLIEVFLRVGEQVSQHCIFEIEPFWTKAIRHLKEVVSRESQLGELIGVIPRIGF